MKVRGSTNPESARVFQLLNSELSVRRLLPSDFGSTCQLLNVSTSVMLSAVIFDLDGVLADSEPWWNQIDTKLLAEHGVSYRGEYHRNVLGVSYRVAIKFYKKAFHIPAPVEEMDDALLSLPL